SAERILDLHAPRGTLRCRAQEPQVAADVDAETVDAVGELAGDDVGREPLADPAGVEADPGGHPHQARHRIDLDQGGTEASVVARRGIRNDLRVGPVVAGANDRAEDRRIETSARETDAVERSLDECDRLSRDPYRHAGERVHHAHLAGGPEPAPEGLEL